MTEEEAKTKWCPFLLSSSNRYDYTNAHKEWVCCKTSDCMMWVSKQEADFRERGDGSKQYLGQIDGGHCGLVK